MPKRKPRSPSRRASHRAATRSSVPARQPDPKDAGNLASRTSQEIARQLLKVFRLVEVKRESVLEEAHARGLRVETLSDLHEIPLEKRDALATTFIKTAKIWATSNGASLGAAGVVTMAADVAALVGVNLRLIQHVCLAYGVPPAPENVDAWGLLLAALGEPVDLSSLRSLPHDQTREATERLAAETAKAFAKRLLGGRGAGRAVPIVGAVFGGLSNYAFTVEVGTRAREFYRSLA